MEIPQEIRVLGGATVLAVVALVVLYVLSVRRVSLARGTRLYDHDPGERVAAPFAEQIEDIIRAHLGADPSLAAMDVDLGTAPDGGLEVWVDGERYTDLNLIPNERVRQVIHQAVESWERTQEG